jgi:DNA polymerase I
MADKKERLPGEDKLISLLNRIAANATCGVFSIGIMDACRQNTLTCVFIQRNNRALTQNFMTPSTVRKKLFLLDAMALIYRAHFAFSKNPRINSKGINTSAVLGFTNALVEIINKEAPTHLAVAFDTTAPTFRHQAFEAYKAHREAQPEDITLAIPYVKKIVRAFQIPVLEKEGYEADDIIGTLSRQAAKEDFLVYMMTPDKDFAQLVDDHIYLYRPAFLGNRATVLGKKEVLAQWGIKQTDQVRDILGLQGDAVDNIPGIPKIGPKTAQKLVYTFGSVENLVANADRLQGKLRENVQAYGQQGILSKELATIHTNVPLAFELEQSYYQGPDETQLKTLFHELEFRTLLQRIFGEAAILPVKRAATQTALFEMPQQAHAAAEAPSTPLLLSTLENTPHLYHLIDTLLLRQNLIKHLALHKEVCFDTETTSLDPHQATLLGIAFSYYPGEAYYVPVPGDQAAAKQLVQEFKAVLENTTICKIGQNLKYDINVLQRYGVAVSTPLFDTMLAHYLLVPDMRHNLNVMAEQYLHYTPLPIEALIGPRGKNQKNMQAVNVALVKEYAGEDADITLQVYQKLASEITTQGLEKLLYEVELPLVNVLASMEHAGVKVDTGGLAVLSENMANESKELAHEIHTLAGEIFNIASPKQLGEILFGKLKLIENPKKTETGQYATGEEVLQALAKEHPIVDKIMEYRELQKLKSTYVDALPTMISPVDGMIHTSYNQAVTVTGRLSSTHPNLQNIPIRTEKGRAIRKAFVPRNEDHLLLSADYSQIELRIMASFAQDPTMIAAFLAGKDIHQATASQLFKVPLEDVDKDMRRKAKTANFGIIYGISAFGLAQRLNIPRSEAVSLIRAYFEEFPAIKTYMDAVVEKAKAQGYVTTLLGRKRELRDINSRNAALRGFAERNAINAPIQGTAAEMIKLAMIRIHDWMQEKQLRSRMILQVHDELVFDAHKDEISLLQQHIPAMMQAALLLSVPIEVDVKVGMNWLDVH